MALHATHFIHNETRKVFQELLSRKIIFVSGKGGTGKTVISCLLGLIAAKQGKRVLLAESHAFDKLSPLFGLPPIGHQETRLSQNITGINLNAKSCFTEYVTLHLGMESLNERVFKTQAVTSLLDAIPGLDEIMLLGRLFHTSELTKNSKYDLIIFDAPASGHFLKMFSTPDAILKTGLVGPLVREVQRVRDFISDPSKVSTVLVTVPESLVLNETLEFIPYFHQNQSVNKTEKSSIPLHLGALILNKYFSFEKGSFPEITSRYFDQKKQASLNTKNELLGQKLPLYCFPEIPLIENIIQEKNWDRIIPHMKEAVGETELK